MLVNHVLLHPNQPLPPPLLFNYVVAGNGVFLHAKKFEVEILLPISTCEIRGLPELQPYLNWNPPRVPEALTRAMLETAQAVGLQEILFYLRYENEEWLLDCPPQETSQHHCRPLQDDANSPYARASINIHSHHTMTARFSGDDNNEDQGFRVYGILGEFGKTPVLRLRIGVFGYFWEIPADKVFEIPAGLMCETEAAWIHG